MRYTQVPADFDLQLFAAEPDIVKPIFMAWDERGRAWVVEARDYPHGLLPEGEPGHDSIKICEDTDGDGRADKFTVFAENLNIPTSFTFANGGIVVAQPPRFVSRGGEKLTAALDHFAIPVAGRRGLDVGASYAVLERNVPEATRGYRSEAELRHLIGPGVSAAAIWHMREELDRAGFPKVKIVASSGFAPARPSATGSRTRS